MAKIKLKKGDRVVVIAGRDKGRTGEVVKALPRENRVIVQGVNMMKRHTRPSQASNGGIIEKEAADPRLQRRPSRPQGQQADPHRFQEA